MPGAHDVMWLFHATAMVDDYLKARDWLVKFCGLRVLQDEESFNPGVGRRGGMTWIGDNSIEIGQPLVPGAPVWKFVERFGPGMHSVALQVADIDATIGFLAERGVTVGARPDANFIFTDPRTTDGILLEWFAGKQKDDPRFDARMPPQAQPPLLEVERIAFLGALVQDPAASAAHLAALMETVVTFEDAAAAPGDPAAGVSTRDNTLALYRVGSEEETRRLWGSALARPRAHLMALLVPDLEAAAAVLAQEGVGLLRQDAHLLLPRPEQTGNIPLAFTDRLLPGDPRAGV